MAISNSAVLAGLLAKLPSFCSFLSLPSLCLCLPQNICLFQRYWLLLLCQHLFLEAQQLIPKKLLGFSFPHLVHGSEIRPSRKGAALGSVMLLAGTHTHACIDQRLIDWRLVREMWGWGRQAEHWSCWLPSSHSKMLLTYTHLFKHEKPDEVCNSCSHF